MFGFWSTGSGGDDLPMTATIRADTTDEAAGFEFFQMIFHSVFGDVSEQCGEFPPANGRVLAQNSNDFLGSLLGSFHRRFPRRFLLDDVQIRWSKAELDPEVIGIV